MPSTHPFPDPHPLSTGSLANTMPVSQTRNWYLDGTVMSWTLLLASFMPRNMPVQRTSASSICKPSTWLHSWQLHSSALGLALLQERVINGTLGVGKNL